MKILILIPALALLGGCSSGVQTVTATPATTPAAKSDFNNVVKGDSNIPDVAKKAMMGKPNPNK
jgi:hypothetical protein